MDPSRTLRPLEEAKDSLEALTTYRSEAELADALVRTRDAVDQSLRLLLRFATEAPDSARIAAFSPEQLPTDELIGTLRRANLISLELAGQVHDLDAAARRAASGDVRAADGDLALNAARNVMLEVGSRRPDGGTPVAGGAVAEATAEVVAAPDRVSEHGPGRRVGLVGALVAVVLVVAVAVLLSSRGGRVNAGIQAFREGRLSEAESIFREAADRGSEDAGVWLYLGRIYRREGRREEAAEALRNAVRLNETDADVRRELGYLFLDLGRPDPAVEQFMRAQELEPEDVSAWVGLIRSLRLAGRSDADEWLARAPQSVRDRFESRPVTSTND
jgi:tetratricopeptide (TPR) repeat protein